MKDKQQAESNRQIDRRVAQLIAEATEIVRPPAKSTGLDS